MKIAITKKVKSELKSILDQYGYWSEQTREYIEQFDYISSQKLRGNRMLTGKQFYTRPNYYNKILKQYNNKYYLVEEENLITGETRSDILLTEQDINNYLSEQEIIIPLVNKSLEYYKKMIEQEQKEKEKQEAIEKEYNNTFGFTDNLSAMAKGKILKILNTKENYACNGETIGLMTRKDFLKSMLDKGYALEHKKNIKYYAKNYELKTKDNEYRLNFPDNSFYVITKTEYDYGIYLESL